MKRRKDQVRKMILIVNTTTDRTITENLHATLEQNGFSDAGADTKKEQKNKKGNDVYEIVEAGESRISPCIGCNYCWLKTPGICSIRDDYEEILKKMVHADQLWVISGTALGFLDHKGKNIYDRILPLATMYLHFKGKQMRHYRRYKQKMDFGLIYSGEAEKAYLERWNGRAALNFESRSLGVFSKEEIKEAVTCMR